MNIEKSLGKLFKFLRMLFLKVVKVKEGDFFIVNAFFM